MMLPGIYYPWAITIIEIVIHAEDWGPDPHPANTETQFSRLVAPPMVLLNLPVVAKVDNICDKCESREIRTPEARRHQIYSLVVLSILPILPFCRASGNRTRTEQSHRILSPTRLPFSSWPQVPRRRLELLKLQILNLATLPICPPGYKTKNPARFEQGICSLLYNSSYTVTASPARFNERLRYKLYRLIAFILQIYNCFSNHQIKKARTCRTFL